MATADRVSGGVIQALRFLGKNQVGDDEIEALRQRLNDKERAQLLKDAKFAPAWMAPIFRKLAEGINA